MTRQRRIAWWVLVIALTAATVGAAALGGWQLVVRGRPLPADQAAEREAAMAAASDGAVAVLSYSPDTLQQNISAAEAKLTGEFLNSYKQMFNQVVAPAAQQKRITSTARVMRAGVETLTSATAEILLFVNQSTAGKDNPSPTTRASSIVVGLAKVNEQWLINRFVPV
jgi:Mce-associated membrane protein